MLRVEMVPEIISTHKVNYEDTAAKYSSEVKPTNSSPRSIEEA
jgi:hypothetical protein